MIINTAILTSEPVSLPVIVLAVGHDGKVSDITAAVKCQSSNDDIIKVTRQDCTYCIRTHTHSHTKDGTAVESSHFTGS